MSLRNGSLILTLLMLQFLAYSQNGPCLSHNLRSQNPGTWNHVKKLLDSAEVNGAINLPRQRMTVPVVFHILWRLPEHNIDSSRITWQLSVLNEDFNMANQDIDRIPSAFKDLLSDTEIEFCLAKRDPEGNAVSGITRTEVSESNIGSGPNYFRSNLGGQDAWDPAKYLNVWVCEIGDGISGFATYPGMADPPGSDGIVIAPQYVGGRIGSVGQLGGGRTLTHEAGHYFGLDHLWGDDNSPCDQDDGLDDTPPQEEGTLGCPDFPLRDVCSPRSPGVMFCNFMDYSDDSCRVMFTGDQKNRIHTSIMMFRKELIDDLACKTVSTIDSQEPRLLTRPNPARNELCISGLPSESAELTIFSPNGRVLSRHRSTPSIKDCIDVSDLAPGLYVIGIHHRGEQLVTRFIKY